jgi:hypothetical protein
LPRKFTFFQNKIFPAKIPFFQNTKKNWREKNYFANERDPMLFALGAAERADTKRQTGRKSGHSKGRTIRYKFEEFEKGGTDKNTKFHSFFFVFLIRCSD